MENSKIKFKYGGKIYQTGNLERQLQQLGITENDIEIVQDKIKEYIEVKTYTFINKSNGHTIVSIYPNLENLKGLYNLEDWELIQDK